MSLWDAIKEFNAATEEFKKYALEKTHSVQDLFETLCPRCVLSTDQSQLKGQVWKSGSAKKGDIKWEAFNDGQLDAELWVKCAPPFQRIVAALFPEQDGTKPAYYALLLDFDKELVAAEGKPDDPAESFTFAAFAQNPEAEIKHISNYLEKGISTTSLLYKLKDKAKPICVEWKKDKNKGGSWSQIWREGESYDLRFCGVFADNLSIVDFPEELKGGLKGLFEQLEEGQFEESHLVNMTIARYSHTLQGYQSHVGQGGEPSDHFFGVFLPAVAEGFEAAAFFLFNLSEKSEQRVVSRLLLLSHVLAGSLNDWQVSLRATLLPRYTNDAATNQVLHRLSELIRNAVTDLNAKVDDAPCGHNHLNNTGNTGVYQSVLSLLSVGKHDFEDNSGKNLLKSLFRIDGENWGNLSFYDQPKADIDGFGELVVPESFLNDLGKIFDIDLEIKLEDSKKFFFPCSPALAWILSVRRLFADLKTERGNSMLAEDDRKPQLLWSTGVGHLVIPLATHPTDADSQQGAKLRDEELLRAKFYPKLRGISQLQGVSHSIEAVLRAKVDFSNEGLASIEKQSKPVQHFLKLLSEGTKEPVCSVLISRHCIHLYWSGRNTKK